MQAGILAAGYGSRLMPYTDKQPKSLLKIRDGTTILDHTIQALKDNRVNDIIIVTGYKHNVLEVYVKTKYPTLSITCVHNDKFAETNNIYSFHLLSPYLKDRDMICICADVFCDKQLITKAIQTPSNLVLVDRIKRMTEKSMKVAINDQGYVSRFGSELPPSICSAEIIGITKLSKEASKLTFQRVAGYIADGVHHVVWPYAINDVLEDLTITPVSANGLNWVNVNTLEDWQRAKQIAESLP